MKKQGFTLVELMVIMAIIGILVSLSVPTYTMNTIRARLAAVIPVLDRQMHDVLKNYALIGSTPTSLDGISGSGAGGYGSFVNPNLTTNLHYISGSGWTNIGAMIAVNVPARIGQGIPGYVESTDGSDGAYNSIAMAFYDNHGTIMLFCGRWDSSSTLYIPPSYLPPGCDNDNFIITVSGI